MTNKASLDWKYHIMNLLVLIAGIVLMYTGHEVKDSQLIVNIGIWVVLLSVVLFFAKNIAYMLESSEPDNLIKMKHSSKVR